MKCKNCGHREVYHKIGNKGQCMFVLEAGGKIISECDCEQFITQEELSFEETFSKENLEKHTVAHRENNNLYPKGHEKVTRGCGKEFGWVKVKGKKEPIICDGKGNLCPSCFPRDDTGSASNHSPTNLPSRRVNLGNREVAKDKDPVRSGNADGNSGSDIPLSVKVGKYGAYEGKDVAEAVRKLKEELYYNDLKEKVDKIFGEFK